MKKIAVECPITKVALILSDTWTLLIMHNLLEGPKGFCELERSLSGISTRTLTLKLKKLMAEKMITKTQSGTYSTTPQGQGLQLIEKAMRKYEMQFLNK